jgi:mono/diheme cytochrome c family protein
MAGMLGAGILAGLLAACGGTTPATTLPASVQTAAPAAQVLPPTVAPAPTIAPKPTLAPEPMAAPAAQPAPAAAAGLDDELVAQGKTLFVEQLACASCHGADGKGNETIGAPNIQGKSEAQIRNAISGVQMMSHLKVKPAELKALAAFLKDLSTQP